MLETGAGMGGHHDEVGIQKKGRLENFVRDAAGPDEGFAQHILQSGNVSAQGVNFSRDETAMARLFEGDMRIQGKVAIRRRGGDRSSRETVLRAELHERPRLC